LFQRKNYEELYNLGCASDPYVFRRDNLRYIASATDIYDGVRFDDQKAQKLAVSED